MFISSVTGTATGTISPGTGTTSPDTGTSRTIGTEIDGSTLGSVRGTSVNAVTLRVTAPSRPRTPGAVVIGATNWEEALHSLH